MERDSIAYKVRRKFQVLAHGIITDKAMSKLYYRIVMKKKLNLDQPQTFNEKIQWCKLYYLPKNELVVLCADKYAARDYVKEKGLEQYLTCLLGVWYDAGEIDWDGLPQEFVLKCNHGCAYNIVCPDKSSFERMRAVKQLNGWLKEDFGAYNIEIHYSRIKPRKIICEEYLGNCITDFKFYCFGGVPHFFYVSNDLIHDRQAQIGFFDMNGKKIPLIREDYADIASVTLPDFYDEMVEATKILSEDFPFVRVDFFVANGRFYFAELTFTPSAGMMPLNPEHYDKEWGDLLNIEGLA